MMNSNFDLKRNGGHFFHSHHAHQFHQNYFDMNMPEDIKEEVKKPEVETPPEKLTDVHINVGMGAHPEAVHVRNLPFIGRIRFIRDTAGIIQFSVIVAYWIYGTFSTLFVILLPQYNDNNISIVILASYLAVSVLCITSLIRAATVHPGPVTDWLVEQEGTTAWEFCEVCQRYRPPRSHHCRRCRQCILRMDHHCPWINNCVGEENHFAFMQLIVYAFLLSLYTFILDLLHFWFLPNCISCNPESWPLYHHKALAIVGIIMGIIMMCGSGSLYFMHHLSWVMDLTTIEWMKIQHKIHTRHQAGQPIEFPPKELQRARQSFSDAYRTLCGPGSMLTWPFPCRKRRASPKIYPNELV